MQVLENVSTEKEVYTTCDQHVLCTRVNQDVSALAPCSHEEADTRIILHAIGAANKGFRRIMLRIVDTDVLVLAVSNCALLDETELWVAFGTGKHLRYIPAHDIAASLGEAKARALQCFTLSPVAIQFLRSLVEGRKLPLTSGVHFRKSHQSSLHYPPDQQHSAKSV